MMLNQMISKQLMDKIKEAGLYGTDLFTVEKMITANRYYLDIATDGTSISYITKERFERFGAVYDESKDEWFGGDFWDVNLRTKHAIKTKPGRIAQYIYGSDCELSYEVHRKLRYMMFDASEFEVEIVTGTDIAKYYNEDYYYEKRGTLGNSCMNHCPSSFFEFYRRHCEMVVVKHIKTDMICARSVIFNNCQVNHEEYCYVNMMSRIYSIDDIFYDMLVSWGIQNGYWIFDGGYNAKRVIVGESEYLDISDVNPAFTINDKYDLPEFMPYIDNLTNYGRTEDGMFVFYADEYHGKHSYYGLSQSTDGGDAYSNYCYGCAFPCEDCHKHNHGGWDFEDEYCACDDCMNSYGSTECENCEDYNG